jgi:surface polysaccharide O-acyltransferase-like enzyme
MGTNNSAKSYSPDNSGEALEAGVGGGNPIAPARGRIIGLDMLRVFCCICIIALHESGFVMSHYKYWSLINTFVRPTLWVFFMLSGYFLLEKPVKSITRFYIKRLSKVGIGLVVYSIVYQTLWNIKTVKSLGQLIKLISVRQILTGTVPWADHFWFVYAIIPMYILTPFIIEGFRNMSDKYFIYFLCVVFFFMTIPPYFLDFFKLNIDINILISGESFSYYILGYAILRLKLYKYKKIIYTAGILNFIATYIFNFIAKLDLNLYTSSINMVIASVFYFVLFYNMAFLNKSGKISRIITYFSISTYSIFLVHIYVLRQFPFQLQLTGDYRYKMIINVLIIFVVSFILSQIADFLVTNPLNYCVKWLTDAYDKAKLKAEKT